MAVLPLRGLQLGFVHAEVKTGGSPLRLLQAGADEENDRRCQPLCGLLRHAAAVGPVGNGCAAWPAASTTAGPASCAAWLVPWPADLHSWLIRSEEHTSELQSHSFISYAVFCL